MRILRGSVANLWNGTTWILAVLAATAILTLPASAAAPDKIYFIDIGKVHRANLDGSGVEAIVTGLTEPYGIDVDTSAGKIYWTDIAAKKIQRANLDGTGLEDLVTIGLSAPTFIALDTAAGKMYWTDRDAGKVQRANLDGSGVEDLLTGLSSQPVLTWIRVRARSTGQTVSLRSTARSGEPTPMVPASRTSSLA